MPPGIVSPPPDWGVVHIGTSPDFCRSYGIPTAIEEAVETLVAGTPRPVAVGRITCNRLDPGAGHEPATSFFGCCANLGLGAAVARGANGGLRRWLGDSLGTFVSLVRALAHFRPQRIRLTLDDKTTELDGVVNIAIGKTHYVASGLKVRHSLRKLDPRFYVLCARNLSWRTVVPALRILYSGRTISGCHSLSLVYAERICVEPAEAPLEVEFDGDPAGYCPCRIDSALEPLELLTGANP